MCRHRICVRKKWLHEQMKLYKTSNFYLMLNRCLGVGQYLVWVSPVNFKKALGDSRHLGTWSPNFKGVGQHVAWGATRVSQRRVYGNPSSVKDKIRIGVRQ